jgi:hypothetical protein
MHEPKHLKKKTSAASLTDVRHIIVIKKYFPTKVRMYRNSVSVFILHSLSVAHTLTVVFLFSLLTLLLIVVLFDHVLHSSLVVARHSSLLVTCRCLSLVVARHSIITRRQHLISLSLSCAHIHTHSPSSLSTLSFLLIVAHDTFVRCPPSPSISSLISLHLTLSP